jgi:uncharacterized damage-inducible protein DinB
MKRPQPEEYPESLAYYISLVQDDNGIKALEQQIIQLLQLIGEIPEEKENFAYAEGKWTIKELIGHMIDSERIFGYRALCIARGEIKALPGFDEDDYVKEGYFNKRSLYDLAHEFSLVREANMAMYKSFSEEILNRKGTTNNYQVSVRAILFASIGHEKHHMKIIRERYLG